MIQIVIKDSNSSRLLIFLNINFLIPDMLQEVFYPILKCQIYIILLQNIKMQKLD